MDENVLNLKSKALILFKSILNIALIIIGSLFLILASKHNGLNDVFYYTEFTFGIIVISITVIQLLLSKLSLLMNKYNKPIIWIDLIQGVIFGILSTLIVITFFKHLVFVVKLLFGLIIALKIVYRFVFFIRVSKMLFKPDLSTSELNKLRGKVLKYNVIKQVVLTVVSLITYVLIVVGLIS